MKNARILLIDKGNVLASKEAAALEDAGYIVVRTVNIAGALEELRQARPDLIVMAGGLPQEDEEDSCLRLREASYIPIMVLGSKPETAADILDSGADAYMSKPLHARELVARIKALLRRKKDDPPADVSGALERLNLSG